MKKTIFSILILVALPSCSQADVGLAPDCSTIPCEDCTTTPEGVYYCYHSQPLEGTWKVTRMTNIFTRSSGDVYTEEWPRIATQGAYDECYKDYGGLLHFTPNRFLQENTPFQEAGVATGYHYYARDCDGYYSYTDVLSYYFPDGSLLKVYDMRTGEFFADTYLIEGGKLTVTRVYNENTTRVTEHERVSPYPTNCREGRVGTCYNSDYEIVGTCVEETHCGVLLQSLETEGDWVE